MISITENVRRYFPSFPTGEPSKTFPLLESMVSMRIALEQYRTHQHYRTMLESLNIFFGYQNSNFYTRIPNTENVRMYYPYITKSEQESNIHSLQTLTSMRIAVDLWKKHEHLYKLVESENFYYAYHKMENTRELVKAKVLKMNIPRVLANDIIRKLDYLYVCCVCIPPK